MYNFWFAFSISLFAGLSTAVGGVVPFFTKKTNNTFLIFSLGLSAGVMVYVSFVEMLAEAEASLLSYYSERTAGLLTLAFFLLGMLVIALIDKLVPEEDNPHEFGSEGKLRKTGLVSALAISVHNFPEGLASFMAAMADPVAGVSIAVAIALHNIPEGITVSAPIYHSTGKKGKAFLYALLSGIAEPVGALVGYFFLRSVFTPFTFGLVYAIVAGIMVYLAFDELLPTAENYGRHHLVIWAVIIGMALMGFTIAVM